MLFRVDLIKTRRCVVLCLAIALSLTALGLFGSSGKAETTTSSSKTIVKLSNGKEVFANTLIVNYRVGAAETEQAKARSATSVQLAEDYPEIAVEVVRLSNASASTLAAKKAQLEKDPAVESVEYDEVIRPAAEPSNPPVDDYYFARGLQGNLSAVGAPQAWSYSQGASTRVAVIDTGCNKGHEDLAGKVVVEHDFFNGDKVAEDNYGHGTHVASIIAANTNNKQGIAGGAPEARLICAKVGGSDGLMSSTAVLSGLRYAGDQRASVVNLSMASIDNTYNRSQARVIASLSKRGIFVAAAAGNECKRKEVQYPAAYPGVVAVGGTGRDGTGRYANEVGCSTKGPYVDIAAPGESIWGAFAGSPSSYRNLSGTSMATPHVSAAAALLAAKGAKAPEITAALSRTADDRGAAGYDEIYGKGLVDFDGALKYYLSNR